MDPIQIRRIADGLIHQSEHEFSQRLPESRQQPFRQELERLIRRELTLPSSAESRKVTILLSDLRGFTSMSEGMPPMDVAKLLNRYFTRMSRVVFKYHGVIDKFMGDAIMVLFGAPRSGHDDLLRAIACAAEMQIELNRLNEEGAAEGLPKIFMGIGIDTGLVFAGTLGSELHREYTVIGEHVNLASRIEAHSLRGQVLLSDRSYELAREHLELSDTRQVLMKGTREPVTVHELAATNYPQRLEVPRQEWRQSHRVDVNMPFSFQLLDEKSVEARSHSGRILDISYRGILARMALQPKPGMQIKLQISLALMSSESSVIYAQILRFEPKDGEYECSIEFSSMDQEAEHAVREFVDRQVA